MNSKIHFTLFTQAWKNSPQNKLNIHCQGKHMLTLCLKYENLTFKQLTVNPFESAQWNENIFLNL